jgi:hypothetical protein
VSRLLPSAGILFTAPALRALLQHPGVHHPACLNFACRIHFPGRALAGAFPVALRAPYNAPASAPNQLPLRSRTGTRRKAQYVRSNRKESEKKTDAEATSAEEDPEKLLNETVEENQRRKTTTFKPQNSIDCQNTAKRQSPLTTETYPRSQICALSDRRSH